MSGTPTQLLTEGSLGPLSHSSLKPESAPSLTPSFLSISESVLRGTTGIIRYNYHDDKSTKDVLYENEFSFGYAILTQKGH